jgi:hypothetical protein
MVRAELEKICEKWDALTLQAPALYLKEASFIRDSDEASGKHDPEDDQRRLRSSLRQV